MIITFLVRSPLATAGLGRRDQRGCWVLFFHLFLPLLTAAAWLLDEWWGGVVAPLLLPILETDVDPVELFFWFRERTGAKQLHLAFSRGERRYLELGVAVVHHASFSLLRDPNDQVDGLVCPEVLSNNPLPRGAWITVEQGVERDLGWEKGTTLGGFLTRCCGLLLPLFTASDEVFRIWWRWLLGRQAHDLLLEVFTFVFGKPGASVVLFQPVPSPPSTILLLLGPQFQAGVGMSSRPVGGRFWCRRLVVCGEEGHSHIHDTINNTHTQLCNQSRGVTRGDSLRQVNVDGESCRSGRLRNSTVSLAKTRVKKMARCLPSKRGRFPDNPPKLTNTYDC